MVPRNNKLRTKLASALCVIAGLTTKAATITDLGTLGGSASFAYDINDYDSVVGLARDENKDLETFLFIAGGKMFATPLTAYTSTLSVNNSHQIAGGATGQDNLVHPAFYNAVVPTMHVLSAQEGYAAAINNSNKVAGWFYTPAGIRHAFLFDGTTFNDISRNVNGYALGINDNGVVVGSGFKGPWRYSTNGTVTYLRPFGSTEGSARAINNAGEIVGEGLNNGHTTAFLYSNGVLVSIGGTVAYDINDKQQVVGQMYAPAPCLQCPMPEHAFEWHNGVMTDLNSLTTNSGWVLQVARAINNNGAIVGYGMKDGEVHGFLFKP